MRLDSGKSNRGAFERIQTHEQPQPASVNTGWTQKKPLESWAKSQESTVLCPLYGAQGTCSLVQGLESRALDLEFRGQSPAFRVQGPESLVSSSGSGVSGPGSWVQGLRPTLCTGPGWVLLWVQGGSWSGSRVGPDLGPGWVLVWVQGVS